MKRYLLILFAVLSLNISFSQQRLFIGVETNFNESTFSSYDQQIGYGITCSYWRSLTQKSFLTLNSGYARFVEINGGGTLISTSSLRFGYARTIFVKHLGASIDAGAGMLKFPDYTHLNFIYQGGLFYQFPFKNKNNLQVNVNYTHINHNHPNTPQKYYAWGSVGVRYGIHLNRKK